MEIVGLLAKSCADKEARTLEGKSYKSTSYDCFLHYGLDVC